jgi:hypothetical protein
MRTPAESAKLAKTALLFDRRNTTSFAANKKTFTAHEAFTASSLVAQMRARGAAAATLCAASSGASSASPDSSSRAGASSSTSSAACAAATCAAGIAAVARGAAAGFAGSRRKRSSRAARAHTQAASFAGRHAVAKAHAQEEQRGG